MKKFYVCSKLGITWLGKTSEMLENYNYGNHIYFFATYEEAKAYFDEINQ